MTRLLIALMLIASVAEAQIHRSGVLGGIYRTIPETDTTRWYFSNYGDDSNDGHNPYRAKKTMTAVNALDIEAGDRILFARGSTWNNIPLELLSKDGTAAEPIIIGAYGSGARPIIDMRDTVTGYSVAANWVNTSGNLWVIEFSGSPKRLWFNGVEFAQTDDTANVDSRYRWYYSSDSIWVYATENPATAYSTLQYPWTAGEDNDYCLNLYGCDYITVQSLHLRGGRYQIGQFSNHLTVDDCVLEYAGAYGIYAQNAATRTDSGIVRYCTLDYGDTLIHPAELSFGNEDAIRMMTCRGWDVHDNVFRSWAHSAVNIYTPSNGTYYAFSNRIHDNEFDGGVVDYSRAFDVQGVGTKMDSCYDNWIYNNYIHHMPSRSQIAGRRTRVFYNWFDSLTYIPWSSDRRESAPISFAAYPGTGADTVYSDSSIIANNTFSVSGGSVSIQEYPSGCIADTFANNIVYFAAVGDTSDLAGVGLWIPDHSWYLEGYAPKAFTVLNNLFYGDSVNCVKYRKWWNGGAGYTLDDSVALFNTRTDSGDVISGNVYGDPLFLTTDNRRIPVSSPAVNVGVDLGFTTDYDGNPIIGTPDIGAFEYQGGEAWLHKVRERLFTFNQRKR